MRTKLLPVVLLSCLAGLGVITAPCADHHEAAVIEQALSAAPPELAEDATVMDWEGEILKEGSNPRFSPSPAPRLCKRQRLC